MLREIFCDYSAVDCYLIWQKEAENKFASKKKDLFFLLALEGFNSFWSAGKN